MQHPRQDPTIKAVGVALLGLRQSITVNVDDSLGKGLWSFLRQIVPDATRDVPVRILAGEFARIGTGIRVWCTVGITFKGDGGYMNRRARRKPLFQIVVFPFAVSQVEPPAVIVDHDADMIRVVQGPGAAIERLITKVPLR